MTRGEEKVLQLMILSGLDLPGCGVTGDLNRDELAQEIADELDEARSFRDSIESAVAGLYVEVGMGKIADVTREALERFAIAVEESLGFPETDEDARPAETSLVTLDERTRPAETRKLSILAGFAKTEIAIQRAVLEYNAWASGKQTEVSLETVEILYRQKLIEGETVTRLGLDRGMMLGPAESKGSG